MGRNRGSSVSLMFLLSLESDPRTCQRKYTEKMDKIAIGYPIRLPLPKAPIHGLKNACSTIIAENRYRHFSKEILTWLIQARRLSAKNHLPIKGTWLDSGCT